ncbi:MAG: alpha/beta hydrolase, partial [Dehalococcoidia bacterium]|nr:alpha/beta hydrolase [Dehalococcoidia bacterium]
GKATSVMEYYPTIRCWVIGGHSLGGAMAGRYVKSNPDKVKGLVLLGAYLASEDDLSKLKIKVASIYGDRDAISTPQKVLASKPLLPPDTSWVEIKGGNHSQFGWYGLQSGDSEAGITREEQQSQVVAAILKLLDGIVCS